MISAFIKAISKEMTGMIKIKDLIILIKSQPGKFDADEVALTVANNTAAPY
jgi:hypothetical protein